MFLRSISIFAFLLSSACLASNSRALFTSEELEEVERYKTDSYVIANQIELWRGQQKGFFSEVLRNTSKEDLALMRKQLPFVLEQMDKADYALWLAKTLRDLSEPPVLNPKESP